MRINRAVRITGIVLGILVCLVVLLSLFGFLLPSQVQLVNTSATLEASSAALFPVFNSRVGQQQMWSQAWQRADGKALPPMQIVDLGGPDAGVGTKLGFFPDGERLGSIAGVISSVVRGRGVITESDPGRKVVMEIDFGVVVSQRSIHLQALGEKKTVVSWDETLQISNPLMRYFRWMVDSSINDGFNEVLQAAEEVALAGPGIP